MHASTQMHTRKHAHLPAHTCQHQVLQWFFAAAPILACPRVCPCTHQVLQWFFAAAPGHPALREICNHIAANVGTRFSNNSNRDTLDRTGPGAWTDVVLRHADGNQSKAAEWLGINRNTLRRKLLEHKLVDQ